MTRLWRLALPVSLQSMMFSLLGLIGIMMVSQLGTTAVAAVGLPLAWVAVSLLGWPLSWVVAVVLLEELSKVLLVQRRIRQRRWLRNLVLG